MLDAAASPRPFVGRTAEIALLADAFAEARAGRGRFVLLVGEPGIGKTRTVEELVSRGAFAAERVWWGRCPEHRGAPAFWPWTQALSGYVREATEESLRRDLGAAATEIALVVPAVRERLLDLSEHAPPSHEQARFRLFASLTSLLARVSEREPLVIVLDDLHSADEGSLQLLAHVSRELERMRLLVLGAQRSSRRQGSESPAAVAIRSAAALLSFRGLDRAETRELVRATAGIDPADDLVDGLQQESGGNPSFLAETLLVLKAEGSLASRAAPVSGTASEGLRALIRRRTSRLDAAERRLLDVAAVIGLEFDVASLQAASGLPPDEVIATLAAEGAGRFVAEVPEVVGRFRFVQERVRETVYGDLPPSRRAELHRRVGLALESVYAGSVEAPIGELAYHFFRAAPLGEAGRAVRYAEQAALQALGLLGYEEAVRHFEAALQAAFFLPGDPTMRLRLLLGLGDAAWRSGDHVKARTTFARAARTAAALGSAAELATAALGVGRASTETGAVDPTVTGVLEQALSALGREDSSLRAMVLARLSMALYFSGDEARRDSLSDEAVAVARRVGDPTALGAALINRHFVLWGPCGSTDERLAIAREVMQLGVDAAVRLESQVWLVFDLLESGDVAAADLAIARFGKESEATLLPTYLWHAAVMRATRASMAGRFAEAAALADVAVGPLVDLPLSVPAQFHCIQRFFVAREVGGLAEMTARLQLYADTYPSLTTWRTGLMLLHSEVGEEPAARAIFEQLAARDFTDLPRDGLFLPALAQLAEVAVRLGDPLRGDTLYRLLLPHAARNLVVAVSAACLGSAERYLGLLARMLGRSDAADRHFEAALAMNARMGVRPLVAHTQYDWARMLLERDAAGDRARAEALLAAAERTAEDLGMSVLARRIDALRSAAPPAEAKPTWGGEASFRKDDAHWVLTCGGESCRLKDTKGIHYLVVLLRHPNEELHAIDLAHGASAAGELSTADAATPELEGRSGRAAASDAGEMLDEEARAAYRRRLADLREDEEEARRRGDADGAERAREEIEVLARELSRAVGIGGRSRKAASDAERARLNVTRAINAVLRKIAAESPLIGQHLAATVRTGIFCAYVPDPRLPIRWRF
jgi:tetratricopeptide (TPR) repeat protein